MKKPDKGTIIVTCVMTVAVIIFNLVPPLFTSLHLWPMFLASVFFFLLAHGQLKEIPSIVVSGSMGILLTCLMFIGISLLTPSIGDFGALAICLSLVLFIIIVGGSMLPFALNNVAFAYMIMAAAELQSLMHIDALEEALGMADRVPFNLVTESIVWIAITLIGGSIMCIVLGLVMQGTIKGLSKGALPADSEAAAE